MAKNKTPIDTEIEILQAQQQATKLMIVEEVRYLENKITTIFFFALLNFCISLILIAFWIL